MRKRLRVAVLTTNENNGGAAKAAIDLAYACNDLVEIRIWSQDEHCRRCNTNWQSYILRIYFQIRRKCAQLLSLVEGRKSVYRSYEIFHSCVPDMVNQWDPDVVHLHWICGEYLSVEDLKRFNAPLVWTLHDSWPVSGSEHHPVIKADGSFSYPYTEQKLVNLSKWMIDRKRIAWQGLDICFICPSLWIREQAQRSPVAYDRRLELIANGVDTTIFKESGEARDQTRKLLGISESEKVIMVGSLSAEGDPIKGFDLLIDALLHLSRLESDLILLTVGNKVETRIPGIKFLAMQEVSGRHDMACLYSCSDVTCVPSRIETHSMMAAESVCSGTPVAAYETAGNPSVVMHKKTGYLAKPFCPQELAHAIRYCLKTSSFKRQDFVAESRRLSLETAAANHIQLYENIYAAVSAQ